jgi:hypothetical protein
LLLSSSVSGRETVTFPREVEVVVKTVKVSIGVWGGLVVGY